MKVNKIISLLLFVIIIQTSCRSTRDITLLQDSNLALTQFSIPQEIQEHKIKPFDNLYLSVLTLDSEVNQLFNPSLAGNGLSTGTQQMFGTPSSRYINGYMVSVDSTVTLPILGEINLVGLNLKEAQECLIERAKVYLKDPTVQVKLLNYKVNVIGEIKNPGVYYNYEGCINIFDAVSMANGITDFADLKNVLVTRQNENRIFTQRIDFTDNSVYKSEVFYLQPNDLVYIPPSKLKRRRENSDTYSKILSTISTLLVAVALFVTR